jgi:hypothetical protein
MRNTIWRGITVMVIPFFAFFMIDRLRRRTPASESATIFNNPKRVMKIVSDDVYFFTTHLV